MKVIINNDQFENVFSVEINTYNNDKIIITKGHINYCCNGTLLKVKFNDNTFKIINLDGVCLLENDVLKFISL